MPARVVPTNVRSDDGNRRGARLADDVTDTAVLPRIWSWPPARLWPLPAELVL